MCVCLSVDIKGVSTWNGRAEGTYLRLDNIDIIHLLLLTWYFFFFIGQMLGQKHFRFLLSKYFPLGGKWLRVPALSLSCSFCFLLLTSFYGDARPRAVSLSIGFPLSLSFSTVTIALTKHSRSLAVRSAFV